MIVGEGKKKKKQVARTNKRKKGERDSGLIFRAHIAARKRQSGAWEAECRDALSSFFSQRFSLARVYCWQDNKKKKTSLICFWMWACVYLSSTARKKKRKKMKKRQTQLALTLLLGEKPTARNRIHPRKTLHLRKRKKAHGQAWKTERRGNYEARMPRLHNREYKERTTHVQLLWLRPQTQV